VLLLLADDFDVGQCCCYVNAGVGAGVGDSARTLKLGMTLR